MEVGEQGDYIPRREKRAEADSNQSLSSCQPNTLLLGQTGSPPSTNGRHYLS